MDYRAKAVNIVTELELPFTSTENSAWEVMRRYIKVTCPYCGEDTEYHSGGGTSSMFHTEYRCPHGHVVTISAPWDLFHANPKND